VLASYRVFLGLMQDVPNRRAALAHLAFAGLIDVQDRMLHNRSYTTGHKSFRARATIEDIDGKSGRQAIVITELPYQVNKARLIERIADLVRDGDGFKVLAGM